MNLRAKIGNVLRGLKQRWGSPSLKRELWNREYSAGRWDHCDQTHGDCVYDYIEKYCRNGAILDLGCGSGNTGNELDATKYREYTGVDISDVAIEKAIARSKSTGRSGKNQYFHSNLSEYGPGHKYDVILFRESIYYLPRRQILPTLDRLAPYLTEDGVFIVRLADREAYQDIIDMLTGRFLIIEKKCVHTESATIMVFRKSSCSGDRRNEEFRGC